MTDQFSQSGLRLLVYRMYSLIHGLLPFLQELRVFVLFPKPLENLSRGVRQYVELNV